MDHDVSDIISRLESGSISALARLISMVENERPEAATILKRLYPKTGRAFTFGITGPAGSGKSTLTDKITQELRGRGFTVGIIAIDPSSPFSGGALLGDRLRMQPKSLDGDVYFRSMATRGEMGGLAAATAGALTILDAFGKDYIIVETVGVGQDELDIVETADTVVLLSVPGLGDEIQALKAGIMEAGDIYVVNKADRPGADQLVSQLRYMSDFKTGEEGWERPIIKTIAAENDGIRELVDTLFAHRRYLEETGQLVKRRKDRIKKEIRTLMEREIFKTIQALFGQDQLFESIVVEINEREKDPYTYVEGIVAPFKQFCKKFK